MGGPKGKKDRNSLNSSHQKDSMQTSSKNHDRLEQLQADHELFLQAFESKSCLFLNFFFELTIFLLLDRAHTDISVFAYQKYDIPHIFTPVIDIYGQTKIQTAIRQTQSRLQSGFASQA